MGLIYGPSRCGKSSLVKAGLLPHLSDSVVAVYVEATPEDTETRILRGLRKRLPDLSEDLGLADTLATIRRGTGFQPVISSSADRPAGWKPTPQKIVIIIDQFEQWLHAHRAETDAELVKALRQCDGGQLQAIVMVRDDFGMAAARLMSRAGRVHGLRAGLATGLRLLPVTPAQFALVRQLLEPHKAELIPAYWNRNSRRSRKRFGRRGFGQRECARGRLITRSVMATLVPSGPVTASSGTSIPASAKPTSRPPTHRPRRTGCCSRTFQSSPQLMNLLNRSSSPSGLCLLTPTNSGAYCSM